MNKQKQNTHCKYYSDGKGVEATRRYTYKRSHVGTSPLAIALGTLVRIYREEAGEGLLRPALAFFKCSRTESFIISCPVCVLELFSCAGDSVLGSLKEPFRNAASLLKCLYQ